MQKTSTIPRVQVRTTVHLVETRGALVLHSQRIAIYPEKRAA
jgi:hypothetical protein